jgi:ketosteroid isomerase-like protein
MTMRTEHSDDEAEVRRRMDRFVEAVRAADIEGVKPIYAPDLVSFDIVPPLQHVGAKAKLKNWADVSAAYRRPLGYEIRDVTIVAGDEVAFAHSLNRIRRHFAERRADRVLGSADDMLAHRT